MNIGLVGCGRWGANILRDLRTLGASVHVVARSPESIHRSDGSPIYHAVDALPKLDGVIVASTTSSHHAVVMEVLKLQSCPVFLEKPLAANVTEAREMALVGADRLFVMDKWRYHPGIELLGRIGRDGSMGRLMGVKTLRVQDGNPHPDVPPAWTYLPHDLAIIREILGYYPFLRASSADMKGECVIAMFGAGANSRPWAVTEFSTVARDKRREITAYFERGTLSLPSEKAIVIDASVNGVHAKLPFALDPPMPLFTEIEGFLAFLNGGASPKSNAADGLAAVELIDRILKESA